jgi:hypothetical protein
MTRLTTAATACLLLAAALCAAQDEKPVALHPSTMRKGQVGRFVDAKTGKPAELEVVEVMSRDMLMVEHTKGRGRRPFILMFKAHRLATGSVITEAELRANSPSGLFEIQGPTLRRGDTYWTAQPHAGK